MASERGRFITLEGGEGGGKSTQLRLLAERLRRLGVKVVTTREPGGSTGAEVIRHVILSGAAKPLGAKAEAMLFAAARADHVAQTIAPALAQGAWVLCDRFADSTRIYQGVLGDVPAATLDTLERVAVGACRPDLTLILDVPAELGQARAEQRRKGDAPDRFESETLDLHRRINAGFRALAEAEPDRCVLIDGRVEPEAVHDAIWQAVVRRLKPDETTFHMDQVSPG
jgi:dTMP kinase